MPLLSVIFKSLLVISLLLSTCIFFFLKVPYALHLKHNNQIINITRNDYGIPYVKAHTLQGALYAWGYVTAEDRLFQLAFKRLIGKGRLSKYLGRKSLNVDKMFREINMDYWARKTTQNLKQNNHTEYQNFQLYAAGINSYVKSLKFLPIQFHFIGLQFQQWTVSDIFLISKLLVWSQSQNIAEEYIRSTLLGNGYSMDEVGEMIPWKTNKRRHEGMKTIVSDEEYENQVKKYTKQGQQNNNKIPQVLNLTNLLPQQTQSLLSLGIMQYLDDSRGSNSWVISSSLTLSGSPLLANDPHLQSAIPQQWHQIRVQYTHNNRSIYIQGSSMTGLPIVAGKTPYVSIAFTTIYADSQDLFKEKIDGMEYMVDEVKMRLKERKEIIEVENQQKVEYLVRETHRGPIINFISHAGKMYQLKENQNISLAWTGFHDQYSMFVASTHMAQISNIDDLKTFLTDNTDYGPNMNLLYSTIDNHIGYIAIGSLPIRASLQSGAFIKPGDTLSSDWMGLIQKQRKLQLHDPIKGYIVTANNKPVSQKYENGVYETSMYTARADRIEQMIVQKINKKEKFTADDMKRMQLDTVDVNCRKNLKFILEAVDKSKEFLSDFNCDFKKQSYQASVYEVFYYQLYLLINPDKVNNFNLMVNHHFNSYLYEFSRNISIAQVKTNMNLAFTNTINFLTQYFDSSIASSWQWGILHKDIIIHRPFSGSQVLRPFYQKQFNGCGNGHSVNVAKMNRLSYGDFSVNHRANIRQIFSYDKQEKSWWVGDTGVSQRFYSKHYDDQFRHFVKNEFIEINFEKQSQNKGGSDNQDM